MRGYLAYGTLCIIELDYDSHDSSIVHPSITNQGKIFCFNIFLYIVRDDLGEPFAQCPLSPQP